MRPVPCQGGSCQVHSIRDIRGQMMEDHGGISSVYHSQVTIMEGVFRRDKSLKVLVVMDIVIISAVLIHNPGVNQWDLGVFIHTSRHFHGTGGNISSTWRSHHVPVMFSRSRWVSRYFGHLFATLMQIFKRLP